MPALRPLARQAVVFSSQVPLPLLSCACVPMSSFKARMSSAGSAILAGEACLRRRLTRHTRGPRDSRTCCAWRGTRKRLLTYQAHSLAHACGLLMATRIQVGERLCKNKHSQGRGRAGQVSLLSPLTDSLFSTVVLSAPSLCMPTSVSYAFEFDLKSETASLDTSLQRHGRNATHPVLLTSSSSLEDSIRISTSSTTPQISRGHLYTHSPPHSLPHTLTLGNLLRSRPQRLP